MRREIDGKEFPSNAAVEVYVRAMLNRYDSLEWLNAEDERFVRALLLGHPNYETIRGPGITGIYVYHIPGTPWRRFHVYYGNGSESRDFAWSRCLLQDNPRREVMRVCRHEIREQIADFRERRYQAHEGWSCEQCGALVLFSGEVHIDHIAPWTFRRLFEDWLELYHLDPAQIAIVAHTEYEGQSRFAEERHTATWKDHHQLHAQLRVLCVPCHKRQHGKRAIESEADA